MLVGPFADDMDEKTEVTVSWTPVKKLVIAELIPEIVDEILSAWLASDTDGPVVLILFSPKLFPVFEELSESPSVLPSDDPFELPLPLEVEPELSEEDDDDVLLDPLELVAPAEEPEPPVLDDDDVLLDPPELVAPPEVPDPPEPDDDEDDEALPPEAAIANFSKGIVIAFA